MNLAQEDEYLGGAVKAAIVALLLSPFRVRETGRRNRRYHLLVDHHQPQRLLQLWMPPADGGLSLQPSDTPTDEMDPAHFFPQ